MEPIKIGVGGPVGTGKTQLIERMTRALEGKVLTAVVTNDIYTKEDAKLLVKGSVLGEDRVIGVETGGCPHTAIREDISMNSSSIDTLKERLPGLEIIFVESGGDNLSATFSPELADFSIYVISVASGEDIPRKAGQGMIKSDLFVVNKIDLAPYVDADLEVMAKDAKRFRGDKPTVFTNLKTDEGLDKVIEWINKEVLLKGIAENVG